MKFEPYTWNLNVWTGIQKALRQQQQQQKHDIKQILSIDDKYNMNMWLSIHLKFECVNYQLKKKNISTTATTWEWNQADFFFFKYRRQIYREYVLKYTSEIWMCEFKKHEIK